LKREVLCVGLHLLLPFVSIAPNFEMVRILTLIIVVVGRAIAGIGAAGIQCGAIMIIVPLVPLRKRPVFTSFLGLAFGVSSVLGPFIGGTFTDSA
jgi:MFS family permease